MKLQNKFINEYDFYLTENQFYKGNILNTKTLFSCWEKINK